MNPRGAELDHPKMPEFCAGPHMKGETTAIGASDANSSSFGCMQVEAAKRAARPRWWKKMK
jgi:hypothetical protein